MNNYVTVRFTQEIQDKLSQSFDCGNDVLSEFLKSHEALDDFFGKTYVMLVDKETIIGYYNISTGHIEEETGVRMGGTVYINCLAIDKRYQRKKLEDRYYSDILLGECLQRISNLRDEHIGFGFVTLSSTAEGLHLYKRNSFYRLEEDMKMAKNPRESTCIPMYLPLDYEE